MIDPMSNSEDRFDLTMRPQRLADVIGQDRVKENLRILIDAAKAGGSA